MYQTATTHTLHPKQCSEAADIVPIWQRKHSSRNGKKQTKWNQYGDTKVTFLSEPGEIYTGRMNMAGHFDYICCSAITGNILKRVV